MKPGMYKVVWQETRMAMVGADSEEDAERAVKNLIASDTLDYEVLEVDYEGPEDPRGGDGPND